MINQFIAYWIATSYKSKILFNESLKLQCDAALDDFSQVKTKQENEQIIKKILKEEFKLEVINDCPLDVKKII